MGLLKLTKGVCAGSGMLIPGAVQASQQCPDQLGWQNRNYQGMLLRIAGL